MLDELSDFFKPRPGRKIVGLENKLKDGERLDLLEDASYWANKFSRRVSRGQFSKIDEVISYHCLSMINSSFRQLISPAIKNGKPNHEIDRMIHDEIVLPLYQEVSNFSLLYSSELIFGMLFFLTGHCHIRWNK